MLKVTFCAGEYNLAHSPRVRQQLIDNLNMSEEK